MRLRNTRLTAIKTTPNRGGAIKEFSPIDIFTPGINGGWYDPSDLSTLFQDSIGNVPVTGVEQPVGRMLDKSGLGNHSYQTDVNCRPILSARYNLYTGTEELSSQDVETSSTTYTLSFTGPGSIELSGTATGTYSEGTYRVVCLAGTLSSTVTGMVTKADLRPSNEGAGIPKYQRVDTSTEYDILGFPKYLLFNGTNSSLKTNFIDFSYGDKMFVSAAVRKTFDNKEKMIVELSSRSESTTNTFMLTGGVYDLASYRFASRGSQFHAMANAPIGDYSAPTTNILTGIGDISAPLAILRVDGAQIGISKEPQGLGNYGNYPLHIGTRGSFPMPFSGRIYGLVVAGKAASDEEIDNVEKYLNGKTAAYT